MATRKIKTIAVDKKFFDNIFEKQRKDFQKKLGIMNLSQTNFTKMIKGFNMITPKKDNYPLTIKNDNKRKKSVYTI